MNETKIKQICGPGLPLPGDDIDTDRIIPARFMKCVTFDGLGEFVFYDERHAENGEIKPHALNDAKYQNGEILIVGKNFGCGSSREHAPQSLMRYGFRALIGESFADIFRGNCTAMGIPAVEASKTDIEILITLIGQKPEQKLKIDLETRTVTAGDRQFPVYLPESFRLALTQGLWDTTALLLENRELTQKIVDSLPYCQRE